MKKIGRRRQSKDPKVTIRYNLETGQPYVIRVPDGPDDLTPPLEPHPGEGIAVVSLEDYAAAPTHEALLRALPETAPYYKRLGRKKR